MPFVSPRGLSLSPRQVWRCPFSYPKSVPRSRLSVAVGTSEGHQKRFRVFKRELQAASENEKARLALEKHLSGQEASI